MTDETKTDDATVALYVKGVPKSTYERWQRAAQRHQLSLSAWVRVVLSAHAQNEDAGRILTLNKP